MSRKKYDINEVRQYAGSHNIIECADHYDVAVTSMYTWLNQHHVDYVHVIAKGERNINKRKLRQDREQGPWPRPADDGRRVREPLRQRALVL